MGSQRFISHFAPISQPAAGMPGLAAPAAPDRRNRRASCRHRHPGLGCRNPASRNGNLAPRPSCFASLSGYRVGANEFAPTEKQTHDAQTGILAAWDGGFPASGSVRKSLCNGWRNSFCGGEGSRRRQKNSGSGCVASGKGCGNSRSACQIPGNACRRPRNGRQMPEQAGSRRRADNIAHRFVQCEFVCVGKR